METNVSIPTLNYRMFLNRCDSVGLDGHRSLSNAIYIFQNKLKGWGSDEAIFNESIDIHNRNKSVISLYLADSFFINWRFRFQPGSTDESAFINLSLKHYQGLSRQKLHDIDFMASRNMVLNV